MNRLHKVVVFHPLKPDELDEVLESELDNVQKRMLDSTMRRSYFESPRKAGSSSCKKEPISGMEGAT